MDKKKVVFQILDSYAEITITDQQDNIVFFEIGGKEYGCWYPEIDQDTSSPFIFVKNDTEYDYPHILPTSIPMDKNFANKYRYVCLDENDSTIPFLQSFEEKIIDIIEKLIHLLSLSDIEKAEEFQKEFLFYWNQAAEDTGICKLYIGKEREYGIGMFFFPNDELRLRQAKKMFEIIVEKEGMTFLGWREVPTTPTVLGKKALECMPKILQGFVAKPADVEKGLDFDRKLYIARKVFEQSNEESYVVSLSSRTIVYKGMFLVGQLRTFFNDLQDSDYESAIALVHSRFSTNTTPSWEKAHPYRFIVHNGEINTIRGNADKMLAREENMESEYLKNEMHKLIPVVNPNGSDSARTMGK